MNENLDIEKCLKREYVDPKEDYRFIDTIGDSRFYLVVSKSSPKTIYCKICVEIPDSPNCVAFRTLRKTDNWIDKTKIWIERSMKKIAFDHENLKKLGFIESERFNEYKLPLGEYLIIATKFTSMRYEVRTILKANEGKFLIDPIKKTKSGKTLTDAVHDHLRGCDLNLLPFMNHILRDFILDGITKKDIIGQIL